MKETDREDKTGESSLKNKHRDVEKTKIWEKSSPGNTCVPVFSDYLSTFLWNPEQVHESQCHSLKIFSTARTASEVTGNCVLNTWGAG